jgi:hypothetical protein
MHNLSLNREGAERVKEAHLLETVLQVFTRRGAINMLEAAHES